MTKQLKLLDDKQLGLLMEIAFSAKPKPPDLDLEYFALYLRKDEQHGITTFSDLKTLYVEGYNTSDFFTLKTSQGLTAARKLQGVADKLTKQINKIRKQFSEQAVRPSVSQMDVNKLLAPEIKRLQQANSLSENFRDLYKKGEGLNNRDIVRLLMFPEVLNELFDEVSVTGKQKSNLREFLDTYINQYSERNLVGQGEIPNAEYLSERWMTVLNSEDYKRMYQTRKVPLFVKLDMKNDLFCHSILFLNHIGKLVLHSISLRPITETVGGTRRTTYTSLEGGNTYAMQWHAIVDNNEAQSEDLTKITSQAKEAELRWGGLKLETNTGRAFYQRTNKYHKFQTSKPHFKVLKMLLEKQGDEVLYKDFYSSLKDEFDEMKFTSNKVKRLFVSKKVREIRTYFAINTKENRKDDIFEPTGRGYKLIAPMDL